jgi:hypothetical protein
MANPNNRIAWRCVNHQKIRQTHKNPMPIIRKRIENPEKDPELT